MKISTRPHVPYQEQADHHGPAPLGFEKNDGRLVEADDYHTVVSVLEQVAKDELSKRKAARQLETSRATINRALNRGELYGLSPGNLESH